MQLNYWVAFFVNKNEKPHNTTEFLRDIKTMSI